ncbi:hypothetical protein [Tomitella biformata]|uniref:hypothetical protein n=1 Tax=Tomitella biformata TaxID=630403 RepID=UPI000462EA6C|nr:hypothetical protein [Tomitella biformata]
MDGIEYIFGTGDGHVDTWATPADIDVNGDGLLDAVALDFDGDGLFDDALWDTDGDGVADTVAVDFRAGGGAGWYTDPDADGTWSDYRAGGAEPVEAAAPELPTAPVVVAEPVPTLVVDTDGDGILDTGLTDRDGDGRLDTASPASIRLRAGDWWEWDVTLR